MFFKGATLLDTARTILRGGVKPLALAAAIAVVGASASVAATPSSTLSVKASEAEAMVLAAETEGRVRVIVKFASTVVPGQIQSTVDGIESAKDTVSAEQDAIITDHFGSVSAPSAGAGFDRGLMRMTISPMFAVNVNQAELEALAADPRVVQIYIDHLDPPNLIQSVPLIGMASAWLQGGTGSGQAVALLDTGVQNSHEFLVAQIVLEHCFSNSGGGGVGVTLCPNGFSEDTSSNATNTQCANSGANLCTHGSHTAGIAAGYNTSYSGSSEPSTGVAYNARLVPVQVFTRFNTSGHSYDCGSSSAPCVLAYTSDQISALDWLFYNAQTPSGGIRLAAVNMSLGGGSYSSSCNGDSRAGSIANLLAYGIATVISAGNDSLYGAVGAPACISNAVTVAATTKTDAFASAYSNISSLVDLFAPGGSGAGGVNDILSSIASLFTNTYAYYAGTSMAAPHVAGAIAAIRSACSLPYNSSGVSTIVSALQSTGLSITYFGYTKSRINVGAAIPVACAGGGTSIVAIDPLTLSGLAGLALLSVGWHFRRRRNAA